MNILNIILILALSFFAFTGFVAYAETPPKQKESQAQTEKKDTDHDDHDDHAEEEESEEASTTIGPDKGIIEKAEAGFKLSPEAIKTMALKTVATTGKTFTLPIRALVQIKDEKSIYRIRSGWIKRIPVQITQKNSEKFTAQSSSLRDGDHIVIDGTGFLRITEIFAEEGASHGHSH